MAKIALQLRREWDPLHASFSLALDGGSTHQLHSSDSNNWLPDRKKTPLMIIPTMFCTDPSTPNAQPVDFASKLTAFTWTEQVGSGAVTTLTTSPDYEIAGDGLTKGTITVKKNIPHTEVVTLTFSGSYLDSRTGKLIKVGDVVRLTCTSQSETPLKIELDLPEAVTYDPISDASGVYDIVPKLYLADNLLTHPNARTWWYKKVGGTYVKIDTLTADQKPEYTSHTTDKLTVDLAYINSAEYKVVMDYSKDGSDMSEPTSRALSKTFTLLRRFSKYFESFEIAGGGNVHNTEGETTKKVMGVVRDNKGRVIEHASEIFDFAYTLKKGSVTKGTGNTIDYVVPATEIANLTGNETLDVELVVTPKGPKSRPTVLKAATTKK